MLVSIYGTQGVGRSALSLRSIVKNLFLLPAMGTAGIPWPYHSNLSPWARGLLSVSNLPLLPLKNTRDCIYGPSRQSRINFQCQDS